MAVTHPAHRNKAPRLTGYAAQFASSPAARYWSDFVAASRKYNVRLSSLLGIAYSESSFFANTPPGTSVMGAISGPGAHQGIAGARAQIFEAARLLHGYDKGLSQVGHLNYFNTGNASSGYGATAAHVGASVLGQKAPAPRRVKVRAATKRAAVKSRNPDFWTYWKVNGVSIPIGINTGGSSQAKATTGFLNNPVGTIESGIVGGLGGLFTGLFSGSVTWVHDHIWLVLGMVVAVLVLIGSASKLTGVSAVPVPVPV